MIPGNINTDLISGAEGAYQVERSLRLNASDSAYLSRTPASASSRKTWTWSGWVKRATIGSSYEILFSARAGTSGNRDYLTFQSDQLVLTCVNSSGTTTANIQTTALFRDPAAWYHLVLAVDTTQATAANRVRMYVNGTEITVFSLASYPSQNTDLSYNDAQPHTIGQSATGTAFSFSGYLANVEFVDGSALTPSSFAETNTTTGQWVPKAYTGSYGTNGFKLSFSNNASTTTISQDSSGNNNHWTANNISVTAGAGNDSLVDTPTSYGTDTGVGGEVRGNYCTWNSLDKTSTSTLANGNLDYTTSSGNNDLIRATFGVSSGKWYWEVTVIDNTGSTHIGIAKSNASQASSSYLGADANGWAYASSGLKYNNSSGSAYGSSFTTNDVIGVAFDADNGTLTFYKNGTVQNSGTAAYTGLTSGPYFPAYSDANTGSASSSVVNFGARSWAYTAPSGFKALCDTNLPAPVVAKPSTVMDVALWTGNGGTQTVSYANSSFSPDFIWFKSRSIAMNNHVVDVVRGTDANGYLVMQTDATFGESVFDTSWHNTYGKLTSISNNSFTVVSGTSNGGFNTNNVTYAGWAWDAGSATVTNTQGSITSQVRANASAGFSIVTYTGTGTTATVGHGLGVPPELIICKRRNSAVDWVAYHKSTGRNGYIVLNSTAAFASLTGYWGTSDPSSTVISYDAGGYGSNNANGGTYVAYCFAPVAGYSAFGSYTGNGSTDGPFVFTGFRPRWVLIKGSSFATTGWAIYDAVRNTFNVANNLLTAESSSAETNYPEIDLLSNGFKLRGTNPTWNYSGQTHIYAAFAESSYQYARAR